VKQLQEDVCTLYAPSPSKSAYSSHSAIVFTFEDCVALIRCVVLCALLNRFSLAMIVRNYFGLYDSPFVTTQPQSFILLDFHPRMPLVHSIEYVHISYATRTSISEPIRNTTSICCCKAYISDDVRAVHITFYMHDQAHRLWEIRYKCQPISDRK
jgi:hypothetical protein